MNISYHQNAQVLLMIEYQRTQTHITDTSAFIFFYSLFYPNISYLQNAQILRKIEYQRTQTHTTDSSAFIFFIHYSI